MGSADAVVRTISELRRTLGDSGREHRIIETDASHGYRLATQPQPLNDEDRKRLAAAGAHNAICVNHEVGNEALDLRCDGFDRAMRESGGSSRVIAIDTNEDLEGSREKIRLAASRPGVDAVLTLNSQGGELAADVAPATPSRLLAELNQAAR